MEKNDKVLMEDFNADNVKIDAALKALLDLQAADKSALTSMIKRNNCRIEVVSYMGDSYYNAISTRRIQFSKRPLVFLVFGRASLLVGAGDSSINALLYEGNMRSIFTHSWDGDTLVLCPNDGIVGMNNTGDRYYALGFIAED